MGTRADFYIGRGQKAKWVGSIAFDGYPDSLDLLIEETAILWADGPALHKHTKWPEGKHLLESKTIEEFLHRLKRFFKWRDDVTLPRQGWPWPWPYSGITDFAYAFDDGKVWMACYGKGWYDPLPYMTDFYSGDLPEMPKINDWPDMQKVQNVTLGQRSGLIVLGG